MTKILRSLYIEKEQVESLIKLSKRTRVPQAVLVREGVDLMLKKREKELQRKKKKKGDNQKGGDQNRYQPFSTPLQRGTE